MQNVGAAVVEQHHVHLFGSIHFVCRALRLPIDTFDEVKGESDSLGGLVLELAGRFPQVNDTVAAGDFHFTVLENEKNRIRSVRIAITPQHEV